MEKVVVVGAGLAGLHSVRALRDHGYAGRVTLLGAEGHLPYDRPPLSKEFLTGESDDSTLQTNWETLDAEVVFGRAATKLRPGVVETDAGPLDFDGLIIATGARPIRLPGDGAQRTLRTVDDARSLRRALRPGARIAIVGAGWIGAEVATAAAAAGCHVTVVEAGPAPVSGHLSTEIGRFMQRWYSDAGVDLRLQTQVESVADGGLALAGGEFLPADEVLTAVGVRPDVGWLAGSGIDVDVHGDGAVLVDERLRTSVPGVCAVGDCAAWWAPRFGARLRVEHWDNALRSPYVAAASLLGGSAGSDAVHDPVPYFWSDQFGGTLQYAGHHAGADDVVWRGDPSGEQWAVCWLRAGALIAILAVDRPRDLSQGRRVISRAQVVDKQRLADPSIPVKESAHKHA